MTDFSGKTLILSGANGAIGREIARQSMSEATSMSRLTTSSQPR